MSRVVTFVDTSVLVEVLRVPGRCQQPDATREELRRRTEDGETLILPTAAVIETGNHIAHVADGNERRSAAERFSTVLMATVEGHAPWTLHSARWDEALLTSISGGARGCPPFPEMAMQGVGAGDVSILAEAEAYERRVAHVWVRIWTLEHALQAWS